MKKYRKGGVLFLIFFLAAVSIVNGNHAVQKNGAAKAEAESSEVIVSTDLNEIFDGDNFKGTINGQNVHYVDALGGTASKFYNSAYFSPNPYLWSSSLSSLKPISLLADWSLEGDFTVEEGNADVGVAGIFDVSTMNKAGLLDYGNSKSTSFRIGKFGNKQGNLSAGDKGIIVLEGEAKNGTTIENNCVESLKSTDMNFGKNTVLSLKYKADEKEFTVTASDLKVVRKNNYFPNEKKAYVSMQAQIWSTGSENINSYVEGNFRRARYDHYSPEFTSTELVKEDGTPLTTSEIAELANGGTVYVRCTLVNKNAEARSDEVVYSHVQVTNDKNYPTSSCIEFLSDTVRMGSVPSTGVLVSGANMTEGIPLEVSTTPTVFTYQIKINEAGGAAVKLGQVLTDDFFQSKRFSSAELVPEQKLIPEDGNTEQGTPGKDYHYTRTKPNENGWNNSDVEVRFYPGDYNEFYIADPTDNSISEILKDGGRDTQIYTSQTEKNGETVYYQAKNTTDNLVSVKKEDCIKIDKDAPVLKPNKDTRKLDLQDSLSGIWKLYKLDAAGSIEIGGNKYREVMSNNLIDGNGLASCEYSGLTNGRYLVMDAAGNVSGPTLITVTEPPAVTPTDPGAAKPEEEVKTNPDGTRSRSVSDQITRIISDPPMSDGLLTDEEMKEWITDSYNIVSGAAASKLDVSFTMKQGEEDISDRGFRTDTPGICDLIYKVTDTEGNLTTLTITYKFVWKMEPPVVNVIVPGSAAPPVLVPVIKEDEAGLQHAVIRDILEVYITNPPAYDGRMNPANASELFKERYNVKSPIDPEENLNYSSVQIDKQLGSVYNDISGLGIDTSSAGTYRLKQLISDSYGNTTRIELMYILKDAEKDTPGGKTDSSGTDKGSNIVENKKSGIWNGGENDITKAAIEKNRRLYVNGAESRPKTMDTLFDPGCLLHILMLLGTLLTLCYTLLEVIYEKHRRRSIKYRHTVDEYVIYGFSMACIAWGLILRSCAMDIVMAIVWTTAVVGSMTLLDKIRLKVEKEA